MRVGFCCLLSAGIWIFRCRGNWRGGRKKNFFSSLQICWIFQENKGCLQSSNKSWGTVKNTKFPIELWLLHKMRIPLLFCLGISYPPLAQISGLPTGQECTTLGGGVAKKSFSPGTQILTYPKNRMAVLNILYQQQNHTMNLTADHQAAQFSWSSVWPCPGTQCIPRAEQVIRW